MTIFKKFLIELEKEKETIGDELDKIKVPCFEIYEEYPDFDFIDQILFSFEQKYFGCADREELEDKEMLPNTDQSSVMEEIVYLLYMQSKCFLSYTGPFRSYVAKQLTDVFSKAAWLWYFSGDEKDFDKAIEAWKEDAYDYTGIQRIWDILHMKRCYTKMDLFEEITTGIETGHLSGGYVPDLADLFLK